VEDVEAGVALLPNENAWLPLPEPAPESLGPPPNPDPNGNMALKINGSESREMNANAKGNCSRSNDEVLRCDQKEREITMAERKPSGKYIFFK
jgi:hypothetical protein